MIDRLIQALVRSKNEAADDLLLQALRIQTPPLSGPELSLADLQHIAEA